MTTHDEAARKIQQAWRKRHANHLKNEILKADVRWKDAVTQARMEAGRSAAVVGSNEPKDRWRRAAFFASRLHGGQLLVVHVNLTLNMTPQTEILPSTIMVLKEMMQ